MKRKHCVPFVGIEVQLHGCVECPEEFCKELEKWILLKLEPDYESDVLVELSESAGWSSDEKI